MIPLITLLVCGCCALILLFGFTAWYKQRTIQAVVLVAFGLLVMYAWTLVGVSWVIEGAIRNAGAG